MNKVIFITLVIIPLISTSPTGDRELTLRDLLTDALSAGAAGGSLLPGLTGGQSLVGSAISKAKEAAQVVSSAVANPLNAATAVTSAVGSGGAASAAAASSGGGLLGGLASPLGGLSSPLGSLTSITAAFPIKGIPFLPKLAGDKSLITCENPSLERLLKLFFTNPITFFKKVHKDIDCFLQLYK